MKREVVVAIVGAGGFVGRALVEHFDQDGPVRLVLFGRASGVLAGHAVAPLPVESRHLQGVDVVVHLAGIAHQRAAAQDYQSVNIDLALSVAAEALRAGVPRFIFVSSMQVHGPWNAKPISPDSPFEPASPYAWSKAEAERGLTTLLKRSSTELLIVRPPLVYGPGAKANFAALMKAARLGLPLPLGAASARRSMISIENLVDAIRTLALAPARASTGGILLPADAQDLSVRDIYATLCRASGRTPALIPAPSWILNPALTAIGRRRMYDSLFRPAVIDRAHWQAMNWSPPQMVADGLRRAIQSVAAVRTE
ncbi:NAD-dependent epimerase/dehydratase family protein [Sulfuriferula sp.]|uniref:NAD-dependent epimerase/dehydratase family protein n=1 Tax=Sulfuriferula sp. TaxID=2025307 RepID=UPI00272F04F1|nr:NAD-dependent epimerase/dehydratase family protein [Sulfuriferula sp.]MDP2024901.1 NAD-dependent epimerase/dehydratase family protein [Sulfuriferula sp.]